MLKKNKKQFTFIDLCIAVIKYTFIVLIFKIIYRTIDMIITSGILDLNDHSILVMQHINEYVLPIVIPITYFILCDRQLGNCIIKGYKSISLITFLITAFIAICMFLLNQLVTWNKLNLTWLYEYLGQYFIGINEMVLNTQLWQSQFLSTESLHHYYNSFSHFFWVGVVERALISPTFEELIYRGIKQTTFYRWIKNPSIAIGTGSIVYISKKDTNKKYCNIIIIPSMA